MVAGRTTSDDDAVFILYALLVGLALGLVTGGATERLGRLRFRWGRFAALALLAQVAIFTTPVGTILGPAAPAVYVATNIAVLAAVVVNLAIPGLAVVLVGGLSNTVAIVANGGYMPVSGGALAALGRGAAEGYSNSVLDDQPRLALLTDIFAMPAAMPAANVFSVGDVLIGLGAAIALALAMHGRGPVRAQAGQTQQARPRSWGVGRDPGASAAILGPRPRQDEAPRLLCYAARPSHHDPCEHAFHDRSPHHRRQDLG